MATLLDEMLAGAKKANEVIQQGTTPHNIIQVVSFYSLFPPAVATYLLKLAIADRGYNVLNEELTEIMQPYMSQVKHFTELTK